MTDRSVPVGDRDEPAGVTGPALARQALDRSPATFAAQVVEEATLRGWLVHGQPPTLYLVKGDTLIVAHVSPATGWQVIEWLSKLKNVARVVTAHWRPSDGIIAVKEALSNVE